jgi:hypothetical protein
MSSRRRNGLSEGKTSIAIDLFLESPFANRFFDYVNFAAQDCRQTLFKRIKPAEIIKAGRRKVFSKAHHNVDIVWRAFLSRNRSEYRYARHTRSPKLSLVCFQGPNHLHAIHGFIVSRMDGPGHLRLQYVPQLPQIRLVVVEVRRHSQFAVPRGYHYVVGLQCSGQR